MQTSTRRRPLRVLLADASPMQRAGLRMALTASPDAPHLTGRPARRGAGTSPPDASVPADRAGPRGPRRVAPTETSPPTGQAIPHAARRQLLPGVPVPTDRPAPDAARRTPPTGAALPIDGPGQHAGRPLPSADAPGAADSSGPADSFGPVDAFVRADDSGAEIVVVGEAADGVEAVSLARRLVPDVLVTDLALPRADGPAVARAVTSAGLPVRVLILSEHAGDEHVLAAIAAGAVGFVRKDVAAEELVRTVRVLAAGGAVIAPVPLRRILGRVAEALLAARTTVVPALNSLTEREREVLVHVARGHSNAEIAAALQVSETTIKTHVGHLLTKLRLRDRTQAVILAYETGLIEPGG